MKALIAMPARDEFWNDEAIVIHGDDEMAREVRDVRHNLVSKLLTIWPAEWPPDDQPLVLWEEGKGFTQLTDAQWKLVASGRKEDLFRVPTAKLPSGLRWVQGNIGWGVDADGAIVGELYVRMGRWVAERRPTPGRHLPWDLELGAFSTLDEAAEALAARLRESE